MIDKLAEVFDIQEKVCDKALDVIDKTTFMSDKKCPTLDDPLKKNKKLNNGQRLG